MAVSKESCKDLKVRDEWVESAWEVRRVKSDKERHVDEDLHGLGPELSFTVLVMAKVAFSRIDSSMVVEPLGSPCMT